MKLILFIFVYLVSFNLIVAQEIPDRTPEELRKELRDGYETPYYIIKPVQGDMVEGFTGDYYQVDLLDPSFSDTLHFRVGEYTIPAINENFGAALTRFDSEILSVVYFCHDYQIFLQGGADAAGSGFQRQQRNGNIYQNVYVLKKSQNNVYLFEKVLFTFTNPYRNEHLPNLRSLFIFNTLKKPPYNFPENRMHILDGVVRQNFDPSFRHTGIFLYVEWEK